MLEYLQASPIVLVLEYLQASPIVLVLEYLQASPIVTNTSVPSSQSLVVYSRLNRTVTTNRNVIELTVFGLLIRRQL